MDTLAKAKENLTNKGFLDIDASSTTDYVAAINRLKKKKKTLLF